MVISFDKYEVAPGFMGIQEFAVGTLQDGKLGKLLKENYKSISGIVEDATMNTIVVKSDNNSYMFNKEGAKVENQGIGLLIDDKVTVYFEGELNNNTFEQDVLVKRIENIR